MKILMVTPMPPQTQPNNAVPLVTYAQLMGLKPRHELTLVTVADPVPDEWKALDHLQTLGIEVHGVRRTEPQGWQRWARRWRVAKLWQLYRYPWRTSWFWDVQVQQILDKLLTERIFDVITVEDNAMGIYRYQTKTPIVLTEHEVRRPRPVNWSGFSKTGPLKWALGEADWQRWRSYQRKVWRKFDRLQVFTERDAASMRKLAPEVGERIRVNPFGIILPVAQPVQEEPNSLVFVGGFLHQPNVDAALWLGQEIMPLLRKLVPDLKLWLVGSYPPPAVRALATEDIVVTGKVPEIEPYLARASVVVAPLRVGGGQRMKVLQALALGKALVTTSLGSLGLELAGQSLPFVVASDAPVFASACARLLASPQLRYELGIEARAFIEQHYSAEAYARRLEAVYREMLPAGVV